MIIAMSGAHRVGKTTLAKAACEKYGFTLLELNSSKVIKDIGLDVRGIESFSDRLLAQRALCVHYSKEFERAKANAREGEIILVDRNPIDLLGYLSADVRGDSIQTDEQKKNYQNIFVAVSFIIGLIDHGLYIPPNYSIINDAEKSASPCPYYITHVSLLIEEYSKMWHEKGLYGYSVLNPETTVEERVAATGELVSTILSRDLASKSDHAVTLAPSSKSIN